MVQGIIIGTITIVTLFLIVYKVISTIYKRQRIKLTEIIRNEIVGKIENIKTTGFEENGWRHNFPSQTGWDKSTILIGKDFLFIYPKSDFPFIFKSELQSFVITKDLVKLYSKLNFSRVYKPSNAGRKSKNDFYITIKPSGPFGHTTINLTFKNLKQSDLEILDEVKNWR